MFTNLSSKEGLILKPEHLIKYYKRKYLMEEYAKNVGQNLFLHLYLILEKTTLKIQSLKNQKFKSTFFHVHFCFIDKHLNCIYVPVYTIHVCYSNVMNAQVYTSHWIYFLSLFTYFFNTLHKYLCQFVYKLYYFKILIVFCWYKKKKFFIHRLTMKANSTLIVGTYVDNLIREYRVNF